MEEEHWRLLEADFPEPPAWYEDLDSEITLLHLLMELQVGLVALHLIQSPETLHNVRQATTARCLHVLIEMLDYYNMSTEITEKYTALAALYQLRRDAKMEAIPMCGITIYHGGRMIIPRLRQLLSMAFNDPHGLRQWALSVGAASGGIWFKEQLAADETCQEGTNDFEEMFAGLLNEDLS